jgi:beta-lactamase regulating signal transducer with metallopeptidase domain
MDASELALQGLAFVLTYAIHSTLLLGLACVIAPRILRSLALRERVWKTAMFGGIVTALVQVGASMETPLFHWTLRPHDGAHESLAAASDSNEPLDARSSGSEHDERASSNTPSADGSSLQRVGIASAELSPAELSSAEPRPARARNPLPGARVSPGQQAPSGPQIADDEALPSTPEVATTPDAPSESSRSKDEGALSGSGALLSSGGAPQAPRERNAASTTLERSPASPATDAPNAVEPPLAASAATDPSLATSAAKAPSFAARWREWTAHGLLAWAAFGACVLALFAAMCVRLARRMRGRKELDAGPLREALDRLLPQAFPGGRRVRLYVAPELRAPVSFGFARFAICVPPRALAELGADEQESMLAHELAHLMRRDPLWLSLAWLVERLFFFQPLHRVARAELHDLAELACDDWAARRTGNRLALASCLARIAEWIIGAPRSLPATSMAELHGRCRLAQRIERLLDDDEGSREEQVRRWLAPAAAVGLGALVLVVPGVSAPGARRPEPRPALELEGLSDAPAEALAGESGDELRGESAEESVDESVDAPSERLADESAGGSSNTAPSAPAASAASQPPAQRARLPRVAPPSTAASPARSSSGGVVLNVPTARERKALAADLASLSESLEALRHEVEPVRDDADGLAGDPQLSRALDGLVERIEQLERRRGALQRLLQVLETLESMPAHPSSTPSATRNSRSFSQ